MKITTATHANPVRAMLATFLFIGLALGTHSALAKDHGNRGRHDKVNEYHHSDDQDSHQIYWKGARGTDSSNVIVAIPERDRAVIRSYVREDYFRHCPPGLAKKRNGCTPPGHTQRYIIGQYPPADVVYVEPPRDLIALVGVAPHGTRYVQVDNDVLLVSEASHKIIDAITLLSAVGD